MDPDAIDRCIDQVAPDVLVNCIGIVKQSALAENETVSRRVNTELPRQLAARMQSAGSRLIHISTDCVFSGGRGRYVETDTPDPVDLYGLSKLDGEVRGPGCTVLRTSFIGREICHRFGLLEWALAQRGKQVKGYTRSIFSGLTSVEMRKVIELAAGFSGDLSGLWHVAAQPISKFDLLTQINRAFSLDLDIVPDDTVIYDRSLDGSAFKAKTGYLAPAWEDMVAALART